MSFKVAFYQQWGELLRPHSSWGHSLNFGYFSWCKTLPCCRRVLPEALACAYLPHLPSGHLRQAVYSAFGPVPKRSCSSSCCVVSVLSMFLETALIRCLLQTPPLLMTCQIPHDPQTISGFLPLVQFLVQGPGKASEPFPTFCVWVHFHRLSIHGKLCLLHPEDQTRGSYSVPAAPKDKLPNLILCVISSLPAAYNI